MPLTANSYLIMLKNHVKDPEVKNALEYNELCNLQSTVLSEKSVLSHLIEDEIQYTVIKFPALFHSKSPIDPICQIMKPIMR